MNTSLRDRLIQLLIPYQPARIGIFGSYARGENQANSDLDVLISFKNQMSLFWLVQIEQEISDKLGISVDLVTEKSLKNVRLRNYVYKEVIIIFEG